MKWFVNCDWSFEKCHSRLRAGISLFVFSLLSLVILSACTDYVSQIDDRYGEWKKSNDLLGLDPASVIVSSMMDSRNGQTYKTVTIGTQTWMAENLNYETANSYCYNDNAANCTKYGRLYTWAAAMDSAGTWTTNGKGCGYNKTCSPTYPVRGVCPSGWHLPSKDEWNTLFTAVGGQSTAGKVLKSTSGNGTEAFSFSALLAGGRNVGGGYYSEGNGALFWSSTAELDSDYVYIMFLNYYYDGANLGYGSKYFGFSVRCLQD